MGRPRLTKPFIVCGTVFVCICVFFCFILHCEHGGMDLMGLKPNPLDLSSFSALTLLVGSFDP